STKASTVAASCGVKYFQPSGSTAAGGSAEPGFQGRPPLMIAARTGREPSAINRNALEPKSCRLFVPSTAANPAPSTASATQRENEKFRRHSPAGQRVNTMTVDSTTERTGVNGRCNLGRSTAGPLPQPARRNRTIPMGFFSKDIKTMNDLFVHTL